MARTQTQEHERAQRACQEAVQQMQQGKLVQPRRLLEAALAEDPEHLPTRIALVELAIRESDTVRAVREAKRATSIALLRCHEQGLGRGDYAAHPTGLLLLQTLHAAAQAHLAAGQEVEGVNALALIVQEDREDQLGACGDLIDVFFRQGRPEGVLGLYRLGFTKGLNRIDVILGALLVHDFEAALGLLVEALVHEADVIPVLRHLVLFEDITGEPLMSYINRRRAHWEQAPEARIIARRMLKHPIVEKTMDLLEQLDEDEDEQDQETRVELLSNLKRPDVVRAVMESLKKAS